MSLSESRARILEVARGELHVQCDPGKRFDSGGRVREYIESVEHEDEVKEIGIHFQEGHNWCAGFASWVMKEAGYPLIHPKGIGHYGCHRLIEQAANDGKWYDSRYDPEPGDMIMICWDKLDLNLGPDDPLEYKVAMKHVRHVGFVETFDGVNEIRTIEGNWKGGVNRATRKLDSGRVLGFLKWVD